MRRFYASLKRDLSTKSGLHGLKMMVVTGLRHTKAMVKNQGKFPNTESVHSTCKNAECEFVMTTDMTKMPQAQCIIWGLTWSWMIQRMLQGTSLQRVQTAKFHSDKDKNKIQGQHRKITADEIQTLNSQVQDHPFMQEMIHTTGKPLPVILYHKEKIADFINFCWSSGSINSTLLGLTIHAI